MDVFNCQSHLKMLLLLLEHAPGAQRIRGKVHHTRKWVSWEPGSSLTFEIAGVVFTNMIMLGLPHISTGWQQELAGALCAETTQQSQGFTQEEGWRHTITFYPVKVVILIKSGELVSLNKWRRGAPQWVSEWVHFVMLFPAWHRLNWIFPTY